MAIAPEITQLIERFVFGADEATETANKIEVALDDAFPDDEYVQQTVEMLARYRPEGGAFLFDAAAVRLRLIETLRHLEQGAQS